MLIVEDVEQDALLVVRELKRGNFEVSFERVDTPESMTAALQRQTWDVVISDYSMPHFSAPLALAVVQERKLDLPFIIVSGTVGEDTAIDAMHAGADDFMVKGRLARLIPAIERALRDSALKAEAARMERQLLISDRMASVGTLAAGVAHEINNPLAALMANLSFVAENLSRVSRDHRGPDAREGSLDRRLDELREPLRDACEAAERVRDIARDLKVFSRSGDSVTRPVDVRQVMESSLRMAHNELRHRAVLVKDYGEVPCVQANQGRLGQVFLNLVINAAQALPDGHVNSNEVRVVTRLNEQGRVVVEVHDTGSGIPREILGSIFDPFFTTKPVGVGTGLGLAICHRIVTGFGGQLEVESEPGEGTVFRISLPVATEGAPLHSTLTPAPDAAQGRRGRILIVDDEHLLRLTLERLLGAEHEVTSVPSGREALSLLGRERYDVVICDLLMREMSGIELHEELVRIDEDLARRIIFMTGGAFTAGAAAFLDRVPNARFEKPFDVANVRALVRQALL